jgi:hypothetical protein
MSGNECIICCIDYEDEQEGLLAQQLTLECGHTFHSWCLERWMLINPSCPMCRHHCHLRPVLTVDSWFTAVVDMVPVRDIDEDAIAERQRLADVAFEARMDAYLQQLLE